jgi:hypothetical protein
MALHTFIIKRHMLRSSITFKLHLAPSLVASQLRLPADLPLLFVSFVIDTYFLLSKRPVQDISLSMAENTPAPSGRLPKRSRQDFEDDGYHPTVPGSSMPNICRNLAARFVNDPRSNITAMRMESSAGHSKVMFELEIPNDA